MSREHSKVKTRRTILKAGLGGIAIVAVGAPISQAASAELPRLEESDSTAQALSYVHDASAVPADQRGGTDRNCRGCNLYSDVDAEWGPCPLFPGKAVAANGWCKGWVART